MENILTGFHAVEERVRRVSEAKDAAAAAKMTIFFDKAGPRIKKILAYAKDAGVKAIKSERAVLDEKTRSLSETARDHRGIILVIAGETQSDSSVDFEQEIEALKMAERATVVILDSITDPHNTGAIIRSADQFGADLVVIPNRHGAEADGEVVARASAGAAAWVKTARVSNLSRALEMLKERGFWVYGASADGTTLSECAFSPKCAIVMGSEGSGISRLLREKCDEIVSIPTCGKLDSLNVSVAAGVLLYERRRQILASL